MVCLGTRGEGVTKFMGVDPNPQGLGCIHDTTMPVDMSKPELCWMVVGLIPREAQWW